APRSAETPHSSISSTFGSLRPSSSGSHAGSQSRRSEEPETRDPEGSRCVYHASLICLRSPRIPVDTWRGLHPLRGSHQVETDNGRAMTRNIRDAGRGANTLLTSVSYGVSAGRMPLQCADEREPHPGRRGSLSFCADSGMRVSRLAVEPIGARSQ